MRPCSACWSTGHDASECKVDWRDPVNPPQIPGIVFKCGCGRTHSEEPVPFAGTKRCPCGIEFVGEVYLQPVALEEDS